MKQSIIGKISITLVSCLVFAFAVYSGRALMSYIFQEFNSGEVAAANGDLEDARFKDSLKPVKDSLVEADRDDKVPLSFDGSVSEFTEGLPANVESSLTPDDSAALVEVSPVPDNLSQNSRLETLQSRDQNDDRLTPDTDLDVLTNLNNAEVIIGTDEEGSEPATNPDPVVEGPGPGPGDGDMDDPTTENPSTNGPGGGGIDLEIGDPDAPIVEAGLEIGDGVDISLGVNLLDDSLNPEGENAVSLPVEELAEEVVTATQPVDDIVTELEARAARFLKNGVAKTPSRARSRTTNNSQSGRIYSGALGGSVSGMIGGMAPPTAPSSRVQYRPVIIDGVNVSNPAVINGSGVAAILPSVSSSGSNTSSNSNSGIISGVTSGITTGGRAATGSPGAQITIPTPGVTGSGGVGVSIPPSTGGLPVPGGVGVNVGGIDIKVNLGL